MNDMELNGHELESKYVGMIIELNKAKAKPYWTDKLWTGKFRRKLEKRLEQLEADYSKGLIVDKAYVIWKRMIKEALEN